MKGTNIYYTNIINHSAYEFGAYNGVKFPPINFCNPSDRSNCYEMDYGFTPCEQTIDKTFRSTKIFPNINIYALSGRYKIFWNINMYAVSARHCRPHPSSMKNSILNWRDRLFLAVYGRQ